MSSIIKHTLGSQLNLGHPSAQGLVGYWLFNEGSGKIVIDLSGNSRTGTINQATWIPGPEGSALNLAGDPQRVDATIIQGIPLTIIVRCRPDVIDADGVVIGLGTTGQYNTQFAIRMASTGRWQTITFNDAAGSKVCQELPATTAVGEWCTIAGVWYSTTDYRLYVNDKEFKATADIGTIGLSTSLKIGSYAQPASYFDGGVSWCSIYNRALSPSKYGRILREPFCMFEREPIELWSAATQGGAPSVKPMWYYQEMMRRAG